MRWLIAKSDQTVPLCHGRQDACRELDQAQRACATGGIAACDQASLDRLQRQCSALGQRTR
jgi:hypothetical protein